eukprot:g6912.t1
MAIPPHMCFRFCAQRGLDLFGILGGECRCGASVLNEDVWHWETPQPGLTLPWSELEKCSETSARAYRYTALISMSQDDVAYVDSVAKGQKISAEEEEDVVKVTQAEIDPEIMIDPKPPAPALLQGRSGRNECPVSGTCPCGNPEYPCYAYYTAGGFCACFKINGDTTPENCAGFGGTFCGETTTTTTTTTTYTGPPTTATTTTTAEGPPDGIGWSRSGPQSSGGTRWPSRSSENPGSGADVWQEYTFESGLDSTRKNALRQAVEIWRDATCINFIEESSPARPYVTVGNFDSGSCYATLGYYGTNTNYRVNLGWCNGERHIGSMVHELGHILGMSHEQQRPDGPETFYGKGPHLTVFWDNIDQSWWSQYEPNDRVYTGSKNDGTGDPHVGYADYDFESIMHYGGGSAFDTIPTSKESLVGNRNQLSTGGQRTSEVVHCRFALL